MPIKEKIGEDAKESHGIVVGYACLAK